MSAQLRVVAVVVAHNRRELLLACLRALATQKRPVDLVVVVDNASHDGSADAAVRLAHELDLPLDAVRLARNTGGAGGFAAGLARAVAGHAADRVWLMDDDTIPSPTALGELLAVDERYQWLGGARPAVTASRVVWTDGRDHPMNTPRPRPLARTVDKRLSARAGAVPVRSSSFVSMLVDASAVRRHGLPVADYFLWNDDFEYSTRLLRHGVGLYVPTSVVEHRTKTFGSTDADPGERFRWEVRNKIWMFTRSGGLAWWEKLLYGGSSVRRWVRTFQRSQAPEVLWAAVRAGVREALKPPRTTAQVLSGLGPVSDQAAGLEAGTWR
ncbi:glycosyltransferase [Quadrisphaera granulorum]|uniref:glycosyltransferase n=1 Tax=Quadrisphaera granulorum TaxID=317664 RepID=UPI000D6DB4A4|nr:glycosyltransferase [Quadrisphaera granulorum]